MSIRIAIPEPSIDAEYNGRSLQPYVTALQATGATAVIVPLQERPEAIAKLLAGTQGVLLPGSRFDVDPQRYGETPIAACGPADAARTAVDELLLQDAFNLHKPILGICHGAQTLNVWRNGTLIQDLPSVLHTPVNHSPGRAVEEAHPVRITAGTRLAGIAAGKAEEASVNSSHHQAIRTAGDNLRIAAVSPEDGVVEAVELESASHFVIAVQWHPERTYASSALSRALFSAFVQAAAGWEPRRIEESIAAK